MLWYDAGPVDFRLFGLISGCLGRSTIVVVADPAPLALNTILVVVLFRTTWHDCCCSIHWWWYNVKQLCSTCGSSCRSSCIHHQLLIAMKKANYNKWNQQDHCKHRHPTITPTSASAPASTNYQLPTTNNIRSSSCKENNNITY